jgi:hypothetical protein
LVHLRKLNITSAPLMEILRMPIPVSKSHNSRNFKNKTRTKPRTVTNLHNPYTDLKTLIAATQKPYRRTVQ